jgi:chitodextrinase
LGLQDVILEAHNVGIVFVAAAGNNGSDSEPPTAPTELSAKVKGKQVTLSWQAATDNVAVTGYAVWRDGARIGDAAETGFDDNSVTPGTAYTYTVTAYDAAGNISSPGNPVTATIPGGGKGGKGKSK